MSTIAQFAPDPRGPLCHCGRPLAEHWRRKQCLTEAVKDSARGIISDPLGAVVALRAEAIGQTPKMRARLQFLATEAAKGKLAL